MFIAPTWHKLIAKETTYAVVVLAAEYHLQFFDMLLALEDVQESVVITARKRIHSYLMTFWNKDRDTFQKTNFTSDELSDTDFDSAKDYTVDEGLQISMLAAPLLTLP